MEAHIISQGKDDPPRIPTLRQPIVDLSENPIITFCVIEAGMKSGEPSVMILSQNEHGSVVLQTSLDKFVGGAISMLASAESRWGWKRPAGYATLLPPDTKTRKDLLIAIKKELEEWDEAEGEDNGNHPDR